MDSRTHIWCARNNHARTRVFRQGVTRYGLPDSIHDDHGRENVNVWWYMIASYSNDLSCVIIGSSTHNERVERLV